MIKAMLKTVVMLSLLATILMVDGSLKGAIISTLVFVATSIIAKVTGAFDDN